MWNFRRKKKNRLGVSPETVKTVLSAEVPDGLDMELNTNKIPEPRGKLYYLEAKPYEPPTDKEIIEGLEFQDNYEAASLITSLKKENAVLKGKLTKLTKKANAYKQDLDNANAAVKELIREKYETK
jgi:hypothetical protein